MTPNRLGRISRNKQYDGEKMSTTKPTDTKRSTDSTNGFVADGYRRAINGIEATIRTEIEQKYADEWNAVGLVKRWFLSRRIDGEVRILVAERSKHISADSLF